VPKLKCSLKIDQSYTKKKVKKFPCEIDAKLGHGTVDTSSSKFLFPESLGEIFSNPRNDYQMGLYKLIKIELKTKNNAT